MSNQTLAEQLKMLGLIILIKNKVHHAFNLLPFELRRIKAQNNKSS
jgi:hypothetical protein